MYIFRKKWYKMGFFYSSYSKYFENEGAAELTYLYVYML